MRQHCDLLDSLASYCAYLQLDPSKRRLSDFISIIDSLFAPSRSTSSPDDQLLAALLMLDPTLSGNMNGQPKDEGSDQWNAMVDDHGLQHIVMNMSPQTLHHNSPALAAHVAGMRVAPGSTPVHMAAQLPQDSPHIFTNPNGTIYTNPNGTIYYDAHDASTIFYNHDYVPPLQSITNEGVQAPTDTRSTAKTSSRRTYPRMRPPPPPSPSPSSGMTHVTTVAWPPSHVVHPMSQARRNQAQAQTRVVPMKGPFVGHGMANHVHFACSNAGPSGLRIKRSVSPVLAPCNPPPPCQTPPKLEVPKFYIIETKGSVAGLGHSGRQSSPINLCSSENGDKDEESDDNDVEMLSDTQGSDSEFQMPDEVEGIEEAHHRAASSSRSSSPIDPKDIIVKGGYPITDKAGLDTLFSTNHHARLWVVPEKGVLIVYVFGPDAPESRLPKALAPLNQKRPGKFWEDLQKDAFRGSRRATAIGVMFGKLLLVYKDIKYMRQVIGFEYDPTMEDDALLAIMDALEKARDSGAPLTSILTLWDYYIWTCDPVGGWYALVDAKLGNHPNFQVSGQHHSGRVTPPPPSTSKGKGKEKRPREDDSDNQDETPGLVSSPRPKAAVRPRPTFVNVNVNVPDPHRLLSSVPRSLTPIVPQPSASKPAPSASLPTAHAHSVVPPLGRAALQPAPVAPARAKRTPVATEPARSADGSKSPEAVVDLQMQLLAFRQAQLDLDQHNAQQRYKLVVDEQKGMEEERVHRHEMEMTHAECEAAAMEERINAEREHSYLQLCLSAASASNLPSDIVEMASNQVREALLNRPHLKPGFALPRAPSVVRSIPRRAASVPVPAPASGAVPLVAHTAPVPPLHLAPVIPPPGTKPLASLRANTVSAVSAVANVTGPPKSSEAPAEPPVFQAGRSVPIGANSVASPSPGVSLVPGSGSGFLPQPRVHSTPVAAPSHLACTSGQACATPVSMRSIFAPGSGGSVPPGILGPVSTPASSTRQGVSSGNLFPSIPAVTSLSSPHLGIFGGPGPSLLASGGTGVVMHPPGLGRGQAIALSNARGTSVSCPPTIYGAAEQDGTDSHGDGFVHVDSAMYAIHDKAADA